MAKYGWKRNALVTAFAMIITIIAFGLGREVPFLDLFDLGIHELGHLVTAFMPPLVMFLAGSIAQVAFPLAMALYFGLGRRDHAAAGFCAAWAGTSARDVSIYAGDAVSQSLPLIGGEHDWAYILGPRGFDALHRTEAVAAMIETAGAIMATVGILLAGRSVYRAITDTPTLSLAGATPVRSGGRDPWA
jgi:hypothetical protein